MSYLIGTFKRDYFDFSANENPMSLVGIIDDDKLAKEHLLKAKADDDYQIINLITREYYDSNQNKWIKIQNF